MTDPVRQGEGVAVSACRPAALAAVAVAVELVTVSVLRSCGCPAHVFISSCCCAVLPHKPTPMLAKQCAAACTAFLALPPMQPLPIPPPAQAHVTYKVITRSSAPGYRPQAEVIRRFRDFVWLQRRLRREYRGEARVSVEPVWLL